MSPQLSYKIIGFGAQMWGEIMPTVEKMYYQVYPRIAALAESGWTSPQYKEYRRFLKALEPLKSIWKDKGIWRMIDCVIVNSCLVSTSY